MKLIQSQNFEKRGRSKELVVILHGNLSSPKKLSSVRRIVEEELPDADIYIPKLPTSLTSITMPTIIVQNLLNDIDQIYAGNSGVQGAPNYNKIILIGHSLGALLARKLYVCACGEIPSAPIEPEISAKNTRVWAEKIERIVLLAGMNRGWRISHGLSLINLFLWNIGIVFGNIFWILRRKPPLIFSIRKGAPFITVSAAPTTPLTLLA